MSENKLVYKPTNFPICSIQGSNDIFLRGHKQLFPSCCSTGLFPVGSLIPANILLSPERQNRLSFKTPYNLFFYLNTFAYISTSYISHWLKYRFPQPRFIKWDKSFQRTFINFTLCWTFNVNIVNEPQHWQDLSLCTPDSRPALYPLSQHFNFKGRLIA